MTSLSDRLLASLALQPLSLRALRIEFGNVAPNRLDAILIGLKAIKAISILGGIVSRVGPAIQDRGEQLAAARAEQKRATTARWRRENPAKYASQKKLWAQRRKALNEPVAK